MSNSKKAVSALNEMSFDDDPFLPSDRLPLYDFYKPHDSVGISDWSPSLTRQEFAEECDINTLMARYEGRDLASMMRQDAPTYYDFTSMPDNLQDVLHMQREAATAFMSLPALVRRDFDNDPEKFTLFAMDPANLEQMRTYGLAKPVEAPPAPIRVQMEPIAAAPPEPLKAP